MYLYSCYACCFLPHRQAEYEMRIIKIIDLILLFFVSAIGVILEIYPPIIPIWLFNTMWIVGHISLILFGLILYLEKKQNKKATISKIGAACQKIPRTRSGEFFYLFTLLCKGIFGSYK